MAHAKIYLVFFPFLLAANHSTQDIVTHKGKEFIFSFIAQHPFSKALPNYDVRHKFYITTLENTKVNVHAPALLQDQQFSVSALGVKVVDLPSPGKKPFNKFTGKDKKGIRITANKPISVYGYGGFLLMPWHVGEGFLGLPVDVLGKEYIVPTHSAIHPGRGSFVQVVAQEDNTQVSFILRLPKFGRVRYGDRYLYSGELINTTLNDLEVFQVQVDSDLSGTVVTSSKPIAVFSGEHYTWAFLNKRVPSHVVEQIPPVSVWGKEFITNPTPNNFGRDQFLIIASKDNTDVNVDWQRKGTLNKGDKYKISVPWNKTSLITTSNPSLVVQYTTSGYGSTDSWPSMSIVPPTQCSWNDYIVYVPGVDAYVSVIIDTASRSGLRVKGPVASGPFKWKTPLEGRSLGSLHLNTTGVYLIYHNDPLANFTSVMYGKDGTFCKARFSFPAGLRWELPIDQRCTNSTIHGGDGIDNDCDGITDEELFNGIDDDNDGQIDEDLLTARPNATFPKDYLSPPLLSCDSSSNVDDVKKAGSQTVVSTSALCSIRGNATIQPDDKIVKSDVCYHEIDRTWKVKDGCGNEIKHIQHLAISSPNDPKLTFPPDVTLFCREKKYLDPTFTGEVLTEVDRCRRNVTISPHKDTFYGECSTEEAKIERVWTVIDKCRSNDVVKTQVIKLVPKDFDECKDQDLNKCHEKAKCTNTEGSYNCTCIDGYVGDGFLCQAPPSIYYVDPPKVSVTKKTVKLTCNASGLPEPTFSWITPDGTLVNSTVSAPNLEHLEDNSRVIRLNMLQNDGSLLIFYTRVADQGMYKCIATNILGHDVGKVNLTVREESPHTPNGLLKSHSLTYILSIVGGVMALCCLVIAIILYRRRPQRRRYQKLQFELKDREDFQYDIFVTFSTLDYPWVRDNLVPLLERKQINYCIHSRDFVIGKAILENMADSVYNSRKVLAVISENYLASKFCRQELDMALYRSVSVSPNPSLLLIRVDDVDKKKLPKSLQKLTFLDYTSAMERNKWEERLLKHIDISFVAGER